jgi:hydrogenase/urease accessory protein HupE
MKRSSISFLAVLLLPSLALAHPGATGHTHTLTPALSDAQAALAVTAAVVFLAVAVWRSRSSRTK